MIPWTQDYQVYKDLIPGGFTASLNCPNCDVALARVTVQTGVREVELFVISMAACKHHTLLPLNGSKTQPLYFVYKLSAGEGKELGAVGMFINVHNAISRSIGTTHWKDNIHHYQIGEAAYVVSSDAVIKYRTAVRIVAVNNDGTVNVRSMGGDIPIHDMPTTSLVPARIC